MELKDVILSTLAELDDVVLNDAVSQLQKNTSTVEKNVVDEPLKTEETDPSSFVNVSAGGTAAVVSDDEVRMLEGIRERLLVLFEGFQSPNNVNIEAKVDLTLNFFEYLLATIDNRLDA
ncbi:MAG TPA: hypothetical protein VFX66_02505, partial [Sulfuricurvum sp.]|nr:hypothetical protein [Sulfuricurvum sp.]